METHAHCKVNSIQNQYMIYVCETVHSREQLTIRTVYIVNSVQDNIKKII